MSQPSTDPRTSGAATPPPGAPAPDSARPDPRAIAPSPNLPPNDSEFSNSLWASALRKLGTLFFLLIIAGLLGATLVRIAPGFSSDDEQMDSRLSDESRAALRAERQQNSDIIHFYAGYLLALARGDLGTSQTLGRPVSELLADRLPLTAKSVGTGIAFGWLFGFGLALLNARFRSSYLHVFSTLLSGAFISVPIAVFALLFVLAGSSARLAIGLLVFPKVYRFSWNLLQSSLGSPHVLAARSRGISAARILFAHVIVPVAPELLALFAVSISVALGAAIPVEAISDSPGVGQLAWQAAQSRDLPVLVNLTLLVTAVTLTANALADFASRARQVRA